MPNPPTLYCTPLWRVVLALTLLGLLAARHAAAADLNYLVIERQVEPFQIASSEHPLAGGLVTELLQVLVARAGHRLVPAVAPWLRLQKRLERGELKPWVGYGWLPQTRPGAECAPTPITAWRTVAMLPAHHPPPAVADLAWLRTQHLLLVQGYDYPGLDAHLRSLGHGDIQDERALTPEAAISMLRLGRGDVVVEESLRLRHLLRKLKLSPADFHFSPLSAVIPDKQLCLLVDASMAPALKRSLFDALEQFKRSGELAALVARYEQL